MGRVNISVSFFIFVGSVYIQCPGWKNFELFPVLTGETPPLGRQIAKKKNQTEDLML